MKRSLLAVVAFGVAISATAHARPVKVEFLQGTITPKNSEQLGDLACRAMDKIVHLKISVDWPDKKRDQEKDGYERLVFWDDTAEYLFPKDTYQWLHGEYVIDGYFIPKSGGMHQGIMSNYFQKVDEAQVLLSGNVQEVPAKPKGC